MYFEGTFHYLWLQVYTLDARNHGETQHTPEMTYDLMSQDTVKFIQDQGLDKAILIGK